MTITDDIRAAFRRGDNEKTKELAEELRRSGEEVEGLCWLARAAARDGDIDTVRRLAAEARELAREKGEEAERMPLHLQAFGARLAGDAEEARRLYVESIEVNRRLGSAFATAELHNLAYVELHAGDLARAKELFEQAIAEAKAQDDEDLLPYLVFDRGVVAIDEDDAATGAKLIAAGQAAFEAKGEVPDPDDDAEVQRALGKAREQLDEDAFRRAQDEGRRMSVEEALR
jgi:tetratricopeptide (TPR) repeat protein